MHNPNYKQYLHYFENYKRRDLQSCKTGNTFKDFIKSDKEWLNSSSGIITNPEHIAFAKKGTKPNFSRDTHHNRGIYTPCILDNEVWKFDDKLGLTSWEIPSIMYNLDSDKIKEQPVPKEETLSPQINEMMLPDISHNVESPSEQLTIVIPEETPKSEIAKSVSKTTIGKHVFKNNSINVGHMRAFLNEAAKYGIFFRVTSGVRPGAKTKQGRTSWHSLGHAIDVTPVQGETYADLKYKIKNSPEFIKWMQDHGYGIFDETTPEVMKRTGASGAHWHIGKDRVAKQGLLKIIS